MQEKKANAREVSRRYQQAGKKRKTLILDEFVDTTGYNRKYAIHILANLGKTKTVSLGGETVRLEAAPKKRRKGGGRKPTYSGEFTVALRKIWAFFWYRCGKILAPFMKEQMKFLEPHFSMSNEVRELLLKVSPSTIDRVLRGDKKKLALKGKSGTKPGKLLKKQIPVRTYYVDEDKKPGFFEFDTVHHCGTSESGEYCLSLTGTDVFSGWIELRPTLNKPTNGFYSPWRVSMAPSLSPSWAWILTMGVSSSTTPCSNGANLRTYSSLAQGHTEKMTTDSLSRKTTPV